MEEIILVGMADLNICRSRIVLRLLLYVLVRIVLYDPIKSHRLSSYNLPDVHNNKESK